MMCLDHAGSILIVQDGAVSVSTSDGLHVPLI
jgi:hypothetical protein